MRGGRIVDTLGAWLLVVLGCLVLLSGAFAMVGALVDQSWGEAAIVTGVMVFIALGTLRGTRQIRRGHGRRHPHDDER